MPHDSNAHASTGVTAGHNVIAKSDDITRTTQSPRRRVTDAALTGYHGARKRPRPSRPMFWESRGRWRAELDERPDPPECLRGVLTTDYTPRPAPPIDVMRRRQRERAEVRSPFAIRGGEAR